MQGSSLKTALPCCGVAAKQRKYEVVLFKWLSHEFVVVLCISQEGLLEHTEYRLGGGYCELACYIVLVDLVETVFRSFQNRSTRV